MRLSATEILTTAYSACAAFMSLLLLLRIRNLHLPSLEMLAQSHDLELAAIVSCVPSLMSFAAFPRADNLSPAVNSGSIHVMEWYHFGCRVDTPKACMFESIYWLSLLGTWWLYASPRTLHPALGGFVSFRFRFVSLGCFIPALPPAMPSFKLKALQPIGDCHAPGVTPRTTRFFLIGYRHTAGG